MTYLWQEERGQKFYRVQTDEKEVADKLRRRDKYKLIGRSMNEIKLWIFLVEFSRPDLAKKVIKNATGKNPKIDSEGVICYW